MPASECVVDTVVLRKANAPLNVQPRQHREFQRRLGLLIKIAEGKLIVLFSAKLMGEYEKQVPEPRNMYMAAFFALLSTPGRAVQNWSPWRGRERQNARACRFPCEDDHVLRTALRPNGSTIYTEEHRMLVTDACIHRRFRVHVRKP